MQQLTNLDASFLYLESDRTPMHIGCALKFASPVDGEMTFDRFKKIIYSLDFLFRPYLDANLKQFHLT
jgi:diacylglycerol O-acyltransferase